MVVRKTYKLTQIVTTNDETKHFEQSLEVKVQEKQNSIYYMYREQLDEYELKCILKVEHDRVKISRRGIINMNFTFIEGETTDTFYESLAGRHHFFVHTKSINIEANEIEIHYELYEGQEQLGSYHYTLKKEV